MSWQQCTCTWLRDGLKLMHACRRFGPGQMQPAFEKATYALKVRRSACTLRECLAHPGAGSSSGVRRWGSSASLFSATRECT